MTIRVEAADLMSMQQAARELGMPRTTLYRWVQRQKLITIQLGGILFVPKSEIERLKNQKATGDPPVTR